jgi:hypothetical protein
MGPTRLLAALGVSTLLIVGACCIAIVWILNTSAASLDQTQSHGDNTLLRAVTNDYKGFISQSVADYTAWTELYRDLNGPRDREWENTNLGPYVAQTFSVDGVFVVSRNGRVVYAYLSKPENHPLADFASDTRTIGTLAARAFRIEIPDVQTPAAGVYANWPNAGLGCSVHDSRFDIHDAFAICNGRGPTADPPAAQRARHGAQHTRPAGWRRRTGDAAFGP